MVAQYTNLKTAVKQAIYANGNKAITGSTLQSTLLSLIDNLAIANVGIVVNNRNTYSFDKTDRILSFSGLTDIYSQTNDFYRITNTLSLTFSTMGSSAIFFNTKTKMLQESYEEECLLIGAYVSNNIYLFSPATLADNESSVSVGGSRFFNIISRINFEASLLNKNYKTIKLSGNGMALYYNDKLTDAGKTERHVSYKKSDPTEFTLAGDQVLVIDTTATISDVDKWAVVKSKNDILETDIVLFLCDNAVGLVPCQVGFDIVQANLVNSLATKVANLEKNSSGTTEDKLPSFVMNSAISTFKRINTWIGSDSCYLLAQITDVHSGGNEKYKVIRYLNELNSLFGFNLLCNFGDIGLDVSAINTEDTTYNLVYNIKMLMDCTSKWIFCKGNHDYNQWMPISILNSIFNGPAKKQFEKENYNIDMKIAGYGYIDESNYKLRIFYLNTSDADALVYSMSKTQLQWFIDSLKSMPTGYNAIVLTHQCVNAIGRWNSYPNDAANAGIKAFANILKDFVAKTSGSDTSVGISWNFSGLSGKLVCNLCGDSHFDNYIKQDGVNYIVRQGYGYISTSDVPTGGIYTEFNWTSQCCFDILAVKANKAKIFRIGIRDSEADIEFTF